MSTKTSPEPQQGPYKSVTTFTIKVSPIEFTRTETTESTHVPPPPAPCGCGGDLNIGDLMNAAAQFGDAIKSSAASAFTGEAIPRARPPTDHDH